MNILWLFALVLPLFLAGCFASFNDRTQIEGEKLGPGKCQHAGIVEISLVQFSEPPNGTLKIEVRNLKYEPLNGIGSVRIISSRAENRQTYSHNYQSYPWVWETPHPQNELAAREKATLVISASDFPDPPWAEFSLEYHQSVADPITKPSTINCSLEGDNAPLAFVKGA